MASSERQVHWENVYRAKREDEVSWFEDDPALSRELIRQVGAGVASAVVDVGGGASRLVDRLLDDGFENLAVLDLSASALNAAKARLGARAGKVRWVVADVTIWEPSDQYDVWHDRAAFHFLTREKDRSAYVACLERALAPAGHAIIATFALDGPDRCSGLPVVRYDLADLARVLGPAFAPVVSRAQTHRTPWGATQEFQFSVFRRA